MRRAKVDAKQKEIVRALRQIGATVQHLHMVGRGCPDILAGYHGKNHLMEIKTGNAKLTTDEQAFFDTWEGQVSIVRNVADALSVLSVFAE